jgi:hypothetical protein
VSFRASVFSGKELAIIIGISTIVSVILYVTYVTGR